MQTDWQSHHGGAFDGVPVVVTGGAGFIGSHLARALVSLGAEVTAVDDLSNGDWSNLGDAGANVKQVTASILDERALANAMAGARYVFHEAALGSVPASVERPADYHRVNVMGAVAVLEAARAAGAARVVYAGSSSAYGDPPDEGAAKVETMTPDPLSPYAAAKLDGEHAMRAWAKCYDLDTTTLRYFNIFGPRQDPNSPYAAVIAAFAKGLCAGEGVSIFGDGEQSRDFTYVDNVVHANLLAARCGEALAGRVFNVACGQRVTVNELFTKMAELLDAGDVEPRYAQARVGDVRHSLASIERAREVLGYEPLVRFTDGLAETVGWYREQLRR